MKYTDFKADMLNRYCRNCINGHLGIQLETKDCIYNMYQNQCQSCGNMKNIVEDVKWNGRCKIMRAKADKENTD